MRVVRMNQRSCLTLVLAIITLWFLQESLGLSSVASIVPRVILSLTLLLLIIQLVLDLKSPSHSRPPDNKTNVVQAGSEIPTDRGSPAWLVISWITILPAAIWLLGVVAGATVFCLVFMKWYALESWKTSLFFSIMLGFLMQLLFALVFKIALYGGVIAQVLA